MRTLPFVVTHHITHHVARHRVTAAFLLLWAAAMAGLDAAGLLR